MRQKTEELLSAMQYLLPIRERLLMRLASPVAIETAFLLLSAIQGKDLSRPAVAPCADGGIRLAWQLPDRILLIEILPDGSVTLPPVEEEQAFNNN